MGDGEAPKTRGWKKLIEVLRGETSALHPRLLALETAAGFLPHRLGSSARGRLYGLAGFRIGEGTCIEAPPKINGGSDLFSRLIVGRDCFIAGDCVLELGETITLGDRVTLSPGVMILTSTHELAGKEHRAGPLQMSPVRVGDGAWIGARAIILPGVTIGEGAVVNAGAVVNKDVAPHTRAGGTPAVQLEQLAGHEPKNP